MPKVARTATDGPISVSLAPKWTDPDHDIIIESIHNGKKSVIRVSEWNARRILGCLSLILGLPLPKHVAKQIQLGDKTTVKVGWTDAPKTLGEKVAQNMMMTRLKRIPLPKHVRSVLEETGHTLPDRKTERKEVDKENLARVVVSRKRNVKRQPTKRKKVRK